MKSIVKAVRVNGLQYNTNRDPQAYRRLPGESFDIVAWLGGTGSAKARFEVDGKVVCEKSVALPGKFACAIRFDQPGSHVGQVYIEAGAQRHTQEVRLDVQDHAWVG